MLGTRDPWPPHSGVAGLKFGNKGTAGTAVRYGGDVGGG